jgi:hypothetical protein
MHVDFSFPSVSRFLRYFLSFRFNFCTQFSPAFIRASFRVRLIVHYFIVVIMCGEVKFWNFSISSFFFILVLLPVSFVKIFCLVCSSQICSSCRQRRQVAQPYKMAGRLTASCILLFMFLCGRSAIAINYFWCSGCTNYQRVRVMLIVVQLVEKFPAFYWAQRFTAVL